MTWPLAFLLTIAIELPVVAWLAGAAKRRRALLDGFAANLLTHPTAWLMVRSLDCPWLAIELGVLAVESLVYWRVTRLPPPRAFAIALLANGITAALSFVV